MSLKRRKASPVVDSLETRSLLTGGAGSTFAIMQSTITDQGGSVNVPIIINSAQFTAPKSGKLVLGLDVAPTNASNAKPVIVQVLDSSGKPLNGVVHKLYDPRVKTTTRTMAATAVTVTLPITNSRHEVTPFATKNYTVRIATNAKTNGNILLGSYLPGDANGDGKVTKEDIQLIRKSIGTLATSPNYNFDLDCNRDGRIGLDDLKIAMRNLGATTTIIPSISANLDPKSDTGAQDRITSLTNVVFTGTTSPGATVNYTEVDSKVGAIETQADAAGNYTISPSLAYGSNTFRVTTKDGYGQGVSGTIQAVIRNNNPPPQLSTTPTIAKVMATTPSTSSTLTKA